VARREELIRRLEIAGEPPQFDPKEVLAYRSEARRVLANADPTLMKQLLRLWVREVRPEPEGHTVHIWYRVPYLQSVVAGGVFRALSRCSELSLFHRRLRLISNRTRRQRRKTGGGGG
jgi:hypothetical protein